MAASFAPERASRSMRSSMLAQILRAELRASIRIERPRHLRVLAHLLGQRLHELVERRAQFIHQLLDLFVGRAALQRLAQRILRRAKRLLGFRDVAVFQEHRHRPQPRHHVAQAVVGLGARQLPVDRAQPEIDVGFRDEALRRDGQRIERDQHVVLGVGIEREIAALLDQRARQRLGERPLRQPHLVRRARPSLLASSRATSVIVTSTPAQGCSDRSLVVWPVPARVRACGSTSAKFGASYSGRGGLARRPVRRLALEGRLRVDHAVVVLDLVVAAAASREAAAPAPWPARWSAARSGMALKVQTTSSLPPLTVAVPAAVMVKWCSSVPFGACGCASALRLRDAAFDARCRVRTGRSRAPPASIPAGTVTGPLARACTVLAGTQARQDQRRPAGVGRRRHPGVDPEIRRRHHAVPVERRGDALASVRRRRRRTSRRPEPPPARAAHKDRARRLRARLAGLERRAARKRALHMRAPQRDARTDRWPPAPCGRRSRSPGRCGSRLSRSSRRRPSTASASALGTAARSPPRQHEEHEQRRSRGRAAAATARGRARTARGTARPRSQSTPAPATAVPTADRTAERARAPATAWLPRRRAARWSSGMVVGRSLNAAPDAENLSVQDLNMQAMTGHAPKQIASQPHTATPAAYRGRSIGRHQGGAAPAPIRHPAQGLRGPAARVL